MKISKRYRAFLRKRLNAENRKRLKNENFTILCNNCVGGVILHELGERFNSPTVNLFLSAEDYIRFLEKLDYYLSQALVEIQSDKDYPVAKLDDLTIYFMHYLSFSEAKTTWEKRTARINRDNLYVILVQQNGCTEEILKKFDELPYKHKLALTARPMPEIKCSYCIPGAEQPNRSESVLNDMDLDSGLVGIESTMNSYWQEQYGYINKFEQYVKEWIETIDTTDIEPKRMALVESTDYFLNFNYTDTLETVYKIEDVLHIHGGVSSVSDIDPIMGHCNYQDIEEHRRLAGEADEVLNEGEASIHRAIANYLRSIYKDTNSIISLSESFWEKLSDIDAVVVVGWAAGKADWPYLRKIQKSIKDDTKWHVYYYDNKALAALSKAMQEEGIEGKYEVTYMQTREFWD